MQPRRNLNDDRSAENHHMFLRQLISLPHSRPALCRAGIRSSSASSSSLSHSPAAPHAWWSVQRFPPPPPGLPAARQVHSGRTVHTRSVYPGGSRRSFRTSAGPTMERRDQDGRPPLKRRSAEEQRSIDERGWTTIRQRDRLWLEYMVARRPNVWFNEQGGCETRTEGAEEQMKDNWHVEEAHVDPLRPSTPEQPPKEVTSGKLLQRHWEPSPDCTSFPSPPGCNAAFDFSVMSYNILSQQLLDDNVYLYRHCQPGVLSWRHRLPNLVAEIQQCDADIVCLQEVQEDHYENQLEPALRSRGYQCEYKKRTGSKPDGCAVVFKSSRFSLLSSNPVEYFRAGDALLDRDNVGLVLLLQPKDAAARRDSPFICVANTHLLYNPRRGDIKLVQLAILLAEIYRLSRLPDGSTNPVVLCGDFNSTPGSPLYRFLTTGRLDYHGMTIGMVSGQESNPRRLRLLPSPILPQCLGIDNQCQYRKPSAESSSSPTGEGAASTLVAADDLADTAAVAAYKSARIEHSLKLQSSYQHRLMPDGRPEVTTCHSHSAMTVDYILFTPEFITPPSLPDGCGLQLLGRFSLVGQSEMEEVNGLPNWFHSSDHLPLLTRFRLRR